MHTATYSPEDNKLRIYPSARLDAETYARVKAAGFAWAPKQELFVAPAWSPEREDLALELCGEIDDEDTSLVERAEAKAERLEDLSDRRAADGDRAEAGVRALADNIPMGQPILIGHHSEKRARKDAEKIRNGMNKAVSMWKASEYWKQRAAGAVRLAKHKERPDVRARRIKGLEADKRKSERSHAEGSALLSLWLKVTPLTLDRAKAIANRDYCSRCYPLAEYPRQEGASTYEGPMGLWSALGGSSDVPIVTPEQARDIATLAHSRQCERAARWISHLENRLTYERAMLCESGGAPDTPEKGGAARCWASPRGGWSYIQKVNKVSVTVLDNYGNGGATFTRTIPFDKLQGTMTAAEVKQAKDSGRLIDSEDGRGFGLLDAPPRVVRTPEPVPETREKITAMQDSLRAGVQVVAAPQLFPTPPELARRMAQAADVIGRRVLEPSAGTGNLIRAIAGAATGFDCVRVCAVEHNHALVAGLIEQKRKTLYSNDSNFQIVAGDFLEQNGNLGTFDRVVMNPPFANGADIKHIQHALHFLKPGGRLVAICANGSRQRDTLKPLAENSGGWWEDLPAGTFADQGTNVNTALLVIEKA